MTAALVRHFRWTPAQVGEMTVPDVEFLLDEFFEPKGGE